MVLIKVLPNTIQLKYIKHKFTLLPFEKIAQNIIDNNILIKISYSPSKGALKKLVQVAWVPWVGVWMLATPPEADAIEGGPRVPNGMNRKAPKLE